MNKIEIKKMTKEDEVLLPLALSYMKSYNRLSSAYKSEEEMKFYEYSSFLKKLEKISSDEDSSSFVLFVDEIPKGFVRYSPIPQHYKDQKDGVAKEKETGEMNKHTFAWERKVKFTDDVLLDDKTLILNQIYLDPDIQKHGLGTYLLSETLPKMKEDYNSIIIEYNSSNEGAKKFYSHVLGLKKIAETKDFDNILDKSGFDKFCISNVEIGYNDIDSAISSVKKIEQAKKNTNSFMISKGNSR